MTNLDHTNALSQELGLIRGATIETTIEFTLDAIFALDKTVGRAGMHDELQSIRDGIQRERTHLLNLAQRAQAVQREEKK